ncbi:MAG: hypothetical protein FWG83_01990 [Oscillospiraceae bacterium]|nr:hypothetical protein [Oscillospiraceae bacterium]
MKLKVAKVFFFISLVPYVFILGSSILSYWNGFSMFGTVYGWDAVWDSFFMHAFIFTVFIPILPLCVIYQLVCVCGGLFR